MSISERRIIFWVLISLFSVHSFFVFTTGTDRDNGNKFMTEEAQHGKFIFQKYNCTACHQLYGLGGYMGPDLTNEMSKKGVSDPYVKAFLQTGTQRMPNFHLSDDEIKSLISYLKYVDKTGISPVKKFKINYDGTISQ